VAAGLAGNIGPRRSRSGAASGPPPPHPGAGSAGHRPGGPPRRAGHAADRLGRHTRALAAPDRPRRRSVGQSQDESHLRRRRPRPPSLGATGVATAPARHRRGPGGTGADPRPDPGPGARRSGGRGPVRARAGAGGGDPDPPLRRGGRLRLRHEPPPGAGTRRHPLRDERLRPRHRQGAQGLHHRHRQRSVAHPERAGRPGNAGRRPVADSTGDRHRPPAEHQGEPAAGRGALPGRGGAPELRRLQHLSGRRGRLPSALRRDRQLRNQRRGPSSSRGRALREGAGGHSHHRARYPALLGGAQPPPRRPPRGHRRPRPRRGHRSPPGATPPW
jgi:hypothetical protein